MRNMDNESWLLAMELFDQKDGVTKGSKIINDTIENIRIISKEDRHEIRKIKALEIIAEELCKFNNRAEIYKEELNRIEELKKGGE